MSVKTMAPDVAKRVKTRLIRDYDMKLSGNMLRGKCPVCGKNEAFISSDNPWRIKCGRERKCGATTNVRDLYPELFGQFNKRYPPKPHDPQATANAYMAEARGFVVKSISNWYTQGRFTQRNCDKPTATVKFKVADGVSMERFVETVIQKNPDGTKKERKANFIGKYDGLAWQPPGQQINGGDDIWIVEGCIDAIELALLGKKVFAALSCANYPEKSLAAIDRKCRLIWALDNDEAGQKWTKKHIKSAEKQGFTIQTAAFIPNDGGHKKDWNDAKLAGSLSLDKRSSFLELCLYHGSLFLAQSPKEKAMLMWKKRRILSFHFSFNDKTYWFNVEHGQYSQMIQSFNLGNTKPNDPDDLEYSATLAICQISEIANVRFDFLYYLRNDLTDESWYFVRITFPGGKCVKGQFTGSQIATAIEFKKRVMSVGAGAQFSGTTKQLDSIIKNDLSQIKTVKTIEFQGYSKEYQAYIYKNIAIQHGRLFEKNDDDFFELNKVSIKTLWQVDKFNFGTESAYNSLWFEDFWLAFGPQGVVALAWWLGTLFAEQIREIEQSYPFLEIVGEANAGKTSLLKILWKLFGRSDYEGFDPNRSTFSGRARNMTQVANLPIVLIESEREEQKKAKVKQFDWEELKSLYNGNTTFIRGVKSGGNETVEPPFRAALCISQNDPVTASEAIMTRICHLFFKTNRHSPEGKAAARRLEMMPINELSYFLIKAVKQEKPIINYVQMASDGYATALMETLDIKNSRVAKNHGQIQALLDKTGELIELDSARMEECKNYIKIMANERQGQIESDSQIVAEFWEIVNYMVAIGDHVNHTNKEGFIALNMPHIISLAKQNNQQMRDPIDLQRALKHSKSRPLIVRKNIKSEHSGFSKKAVYCWIFKGHLNEKSHYNDVDY